MNHLMRVRTTISGTAGGDCLNILHFFQGEPPAGTDAQDVTDAAGAFWQQITAQWLPTTSYTVDPAVEVFRDDTGELTNILSGNSHTGAGIITGADPLPPQTQALIRWRTPGIVDGRRLTGRTYIPGLLESASDASGTPEAGLVSTLDLAIAALFSGDFSPLVVWSRPVVAPATPRAGTSSLVTAGSVAPFFAVLRSRRQ